MFLDEWLLIGRTFSRRRSGDGGGVMRAIKGNIWAMATFAPDVAFSPQLDVSERDARGFVLRRMACSFERQPFTEPLSRTIVDPSKSNFPCNVNKMETSHGTSDWHRGP